MGKSMGRCPKPHTLFEKSAAKTLLCLRRENMDVKGKSECFCK
jgi:hypothetical protein